jgi:two-component system, response regulator PdtaR
MVADMGDAGENVARILIVEDEILVAMDLAATLEQVGHEVVGIAPDMPRAVTLAETPVDLALVDLNLRDGLTGPQIGMRLSEQRVAVLFVTANPRILGEGVAGTIGVITKPTDSELVRDAVQYALGKRSGDAPAAAPRGLRLFG